MLLSLFGCKEEVIDPHRQGEFTYQINGELRSGSFAYAGCLEGTPCLEGDQTSLFIFFEIDSSYSDNSIHYTFPLQLGKTVCYQDTLKRYFRPSTNFYTTSSSGHVLSAMWDVNKSDDVEDYVEVLTLTEQRMSGTFQASFTVRAKNPYGVLSLPDKIVITNGYFDVPFVDNE